jgi:hypothetical protein
VEIWEEVMVISWPLFAWARKGSMVEALTWLMAAAAPAASPLFLRSVYSTPAAWTLLKKVDNVCPAVCGSRVATPAATIREAPVSPALRMAELAELPIVWIPFEVPRSIPPPASTTR